MIHATYIGVRRRLRGKTALLQLAGGGYRAQFDDLRVKESHGWHYFRAGDFRIDWENERFDV